MIQSEHLDIRTVTMGISLLDCIRDSADETCGAVYAKILRRAERLVPECEAIEREFGIPIVNKRISITPASLLMGGFGPDDPVKLALTLERAARDAGVNFIGGYSALVHKGYTDADRRLIDSIPEALVATTAVCSSVNVATTKAGINMNAVRDMGVLIKKAAGLTADSGGSACARLVVFANAPEDNPFMAGAFHGIGEPECVINVGVSGPGVVLNAVEKVRGQDFTVLAETVKKTAFKITRMGQIVAQEAGKRLGAEFGIVDLSLALPVVDVNSRDFIFRRTGANAEILEGKGISAEVINIHTIKPLDVEAILDSIRKCGCAVSCEEHSLINGLGDSIAQTIVRFHPCPLEYVAMADEFGQSGKPDELMSFYHLDKEHVVEAAEKAIGRKKK